MRLEGHKEVHGGGDSLLDGKMVPEAELLEDRTFFLVIQYQVLAFSTGRVGV